MLGPEHPDTLTSLNNLATLHAAAGATDQAFDLFARSTAAESRQLARRLLAAARSAAEAAVRQASTSLHAFVSLVWQEFGNSPRHVGLAMDVVLQRKAAELEMAYSQWQSLLSDRHPHLREEIKRYANLAEEVSHKTLAGPTPGDDPRRHLQILRDMESRLDDLYAELARQLPELALEKRLLDVDRQVVALALSEGTTLVEFLQLSEVDFKAIRARGESQWKAARYLAFVLQAGEPDAVRIINLGLAEPINKMIATFRETLTSGIEGRGRGEDEPNPADPAGTEGDRLREKIFDPLGLKIGSVVLLAPDGEISQMPFEVLPAAEGGRYLIDEFRISYLNTGRDLVRVQAKPEIEARVPVVVADPQFDLDTEGGTSSSAPGDDSFAEELRRGEGFDPLPGTGVEGERIGKRLGVTPWVRKDASKSRLAGIRSPFIVHAATHGYFLDAAKVLSAHFSHELGLKNAFGRLEGFGMADPMSRSGLALAGAKSYVERKLPAEAENGLLSAADASGLDLRATELVVLSACDTARGEARVGAGVFGLQRGFVLAGAKTLVMSLAKADDLATVLLMDRFYVNLLQGMGRADALRAAQWYLRMVKVSEIREEWLNDEMIERLSGGNESARERMRGWRDKKDSFRPFGEPGYWGVFILQGETGPLRFV